MARVSSKLVYQALLKQIETRLFAPGSRLPSESELSKTLEASRMTVRKALAQLEAEDKIFRRPGVGSFVKLPTMPSTKNQQKVKIGITGIARNESLRAGFPGDVYECLRKSCIQNNCEIVFPPNEAFFAGEGADAFFTPLLRMEEFDKAAYVAQRKPLVILNRITDRPELSYVAIDYVEATSRVIKRMLQNGAKNIMFIGGAAFNSGSHYPHYMREQGYRMGYAQAGEAVNEDLIIPLEFNYQEVVQKLIQYQCDVVFVSGELLMVPTHAAVGMALQDLHKHLSLFCFDDTHEFARLDGVSVSCGHMPLMEMCNRAVKFMAAKVRGENMSETIHEIFPLQYRITDCPFLI